MKIASSATVLTAPAVALEDRGAVNESDMRGRIHRLLVRRLLRANRGGTGFTVGEGPTVADLALYYLVELARDNGFGEAVDRYPALAAFAQRIASRPRIAAYLASPRRPGFTPLAR